MHFREFLGRKSRECKFFFKKDSSKHWYTAELTERQGGLKRARLKFSEIREKYQGAVEGIFLFPKFLRRISIFEKNYGVYKIFGICPVLEKWQGKQRLETTE